MFDLFKKNENKGPQDVKALRDTLLRFIKEELQKSEGGEGRHIKGIHLFIDVDGSERHLYEGAVYLEEKDRFKAEVQRIADDFAVDLPESWIMEIRFEKDFPPEAIKLNSLPVALLLRTKDLTVQRSDTAFIKILNGEAEQTEYLLSSDKGKINIGRENRVQVEQGFFRINQIAFPGGASNESNKFISRQHAHIEWNNDGQCFSIYADEGGVPPRNKIKIKTATDDNLIKLHSTHIGHRLAEGDQIILGESAVIQFSYNSQESKNE